MVRHGLCVASVAGLALVAEATVYRPGMVQAKFAGADINFDHNAVPSLISNLTENVYAKLDYTYGTFMANMSVGNSTAAQTNPWSGGSSAWNSNYTLFAYEGEIFLANGQTVAMAGCFDDGSAAVVNGVTLFNQGDSSGFNGGANCLATFTAPSAGWYPVNAWVWDWANGKNICKGYISGVQYNLAGVTDNYTDGSVWKPLSDDGKMSLLRVATSEVDFQTVYAIGVSGADLAVNFDAANMPTDCTKAELFVCWGDADGGTCTSHWPNVTKVCEIGQTEKAVPIVAKVAGAASAAYARVLLRCIDDGARTDAAVSSFESWTEAYSNLTTFDTTWAFGVVRIDRGDCSDDALYGAVTTFGDGAASATMTMQFSTRQDISADVTESEPVEVSERMRWTMFPMTSIYGSAAGYARLKLVNDKGVTSYSSIIDFTPPEAVSAADYAMRVDWTITDEAVNEDDFQVLVRLSEDRIANFLYSDCQPDGSDIVFFDASQTVRLVYEIDTWNPEGESCIWVRLPHAQSGVGFTMCYGRENVRSRANGVAVWDGYTGVWHMGEDAGKALDATGHGLDGRPTVGGNNNESAETVMVAYENGVVGRARVNARANDSNVTYMSIPSYDSYALGGEFTISGWFHADDINGGENIFARRKHYGDPGGFHIVLKNSKQADARGDTARSIVVTWPDITEKWVYLAFVYKGDSLAAYVNGACQKSGTIGAASDNGQQLSIGNNSVGNAVKFNGQYDEVRLSKGAMSASRVAADYATMFKASFLRDSGAYFTDERMPLIDEADVVWGENGTEISYHLSQGVGDVYAVFTDEATGEQHTVAIADGVDARKAAVSGTFSVSSDNLPPRNVYAWAVFVRNDDLGRFTVVNGSGKYFAGAVDPTARYVSTTGSDLNDGLTIAKAFATMQRALDSLGAEGGTVYLEDGDYAFDAAIEQYWQKCGFVVTTPVTITSRSRDASKVRITHGSNSPRVFALVNDGALLAHVTIWGGTATDGSNGNVDGGSISDCIISNGVCAAWNGHGAIRMNAAAGRIVRTVFVDNDGSGNDNGGALELNRGTVENCLFFRNKCSGGGVVRMYNDSRLVNCTIVGNTGPTSAGVYTSSSNARVVNCAIFANVTSVDATGHAKVWKGDSNCFVNCAADVEINDSCVCGFAGLRDIEAGDFTLTPISCALNAGLAYEESGATSPTDLAGGARVVDGVVDAGCYEASFTEFDADFGLSAKAGSVPFEVTFSAAVRCGEGAVTYEWDFDGDGTTDLVSGSPTEKFIFENAGVYSPRLKVTDSNGSVQVVKTAAFKAAPKTLYANPANAAGQQFPYDTPEKAAVNLQDAIDAADDGSQIWLADGFYVRSLNGNEGGFTINNGIRMESISGIPENCVLSNRVWASGGNSDHRCLVLNHPQAFAAGLTLASGSYDQGVGGCLLIDNLGGTVSNCVIRNGRATNQLGDGGGAYLSAGLITHSIIDGCTCVEMRQSKFASLSMHGSSRVENCLVRNCKGDNNLNIVYVGDGSQLINCTIVDSQCRADGYYNGTHCTDFSGVYADSGALVQNCAIYGVWRRDESDSEVILQAPWRGTADSFVNCATDGREPINETCLLITADAFANYAAQDYKPSKASALRNAGAEAVLSSTTDLADGPRVSGARIDIGCYEGVPLGMTILVR